MPIKITEVQFKDEFDRLVNAISNAKLTNDLIVVGSWAEYLYEKGNIFNGFSAMTLTEDADILVKNLRSPNKEINFVKFAKEQGFGYSELRDFDKSSLLIGQGGFEVEFLIAQRGSGGQKLPRTNVGVNAQQLTHLSILRDNTTTINYKGITLLAPTPEAYTLQKMILNRAKDREKIKNIYPYIDKERYNDLKQTLSNKELHNVETYERTYLSKERMSDLIPKIDAVYVKPHIRNGHNVRGYWRNKRNVH